MTIRVGLSVLPAVLLATLLAAGSTVAISAPAADATPTTTTCLTATQTAATVAITNRLSAIADHRTTTEADVTLTAGDRAALDAIYSYDATGLNGLKTSIAAATECAAAKSLASQIVLNYRVYALVGPQTRLAMAIDAGAAAITDLTAIEPTLTLTIAADRAAGKDVTAAQADLVDLTSQLGVAGAALSGGSTTLLALTPAGYPGNETTLTTTRTSVRAAGSALAKAADDSAAILALIPAT